MSSSPSPKVSPSRRYFRARLLSILNPFFLGSIGVLSLVGFCIWQYWLNPESLITSVEQEEKQPTKTLLFPETSTESNSSSTSSNTNSNSNTKVESDRNSVISNQNSTSRTSANQITSNSNSNPDPDQTFDSILGQSDPTNEIFQTVTAEKNPLNKPKVGEQTKLYEQLKTMPNMFPDLIPKKTAPAATNPNPINSNNSGGLPRTQVNQYQLRNNGIQSGSAAPVTSPLSQAVNQVMSVQAQNQAARTQAQTAPVQTPTLPRGNVQEYGNYSSYDSYGNGATNQTSPYGGAANGIGVNPYSSGQVPAQGYNNGNGGVTEPDFPAYGY